MTTVAIDKPEQREVVRTEPTWNRPQYRPNVDILERTDELTILADMPGASAEDVEIQFENGTLTLHAKVKERQSQETSYVLDEYGTGDFHRTFQVSEIIDSARIHAEYKDGVLIVHLPKTEAVKPRKIAVNATSG